MAERTSHGPADRGPGITGNDLPTLRGLLKHAVYRRLRGLVRGSTLTVGCLFSGGVDSLLVLTLMEEAAASLRAVTPSLRARFFLHNVAILNGPAGRLPPDRITALRAFDAWTNICEQEGSPTEYRLVLVDRPADPAFEELIRTRVLATDTQCTVMHLNIAGAIFAAGVPRDETLAGGQTVRALSKGDVSAFMKTSGLGALAAATEGVLCSDRTQSAPCAPSPASPGRCRVPSCKLVSGVGCAGGFCKLCCGAAFKLYSPVPSADIARLVTPPDKRRALFFAQPQNTAALAEEIERLKALYPSAPCIPHKNGTARGAGQAVHQEVEAALGTLLDASTPVGPEELPEVLLSGQGADELLLGYSRYSTVRMHGGVEGVAAEAARDRTGLWASNLARDDRSIALGGREIRCPFLDEDVYDYIVHHCSIEWLLQEGGPAGWQKDYTKWTIRTLLKDLGLAEASNYKKRAVQFGSGSAKGMGPGGEGGDPKPRRRTKGDHRI